MSRNPMKILNIDGGNLHLSWTIWGISMKFSGKMWLMIILKVTKHQGFTLSLEDAFSEKPQEGIKLSSLPSPNLLRIKRERTLWIWLCILQDILRFPTKLLVKLRFEDFWIFLRLSSLFTIFSPKVITGLWKRYGVR